MNTLPTPLQETVRATLEELTHLTENIPVFIDSAYLLRVAGLAMELLNLQRALTYLYSPTLTTNQLVDQITQALETTDAKISAYHAKQTHLRQQTSTAIH